MGLTLLLSGWNRLLGGGCRDRALYLGSLRPQDLPAPITPLITVGVPVAQARHLIPLYDEFNLRLISNYGGVAVLPHFDGRFGFPKEVVDFPRGNESQVLIS